MCRLFHSVLVVVGFFHCSVTSQFVESPCPGTFEYRSDRSGIYGVIHLQPVGPISYIHMIANFTIAARLPSNYVGRIETISTAALALNHFYQDSPIDYRVHFPVTNPVPRLTALVVNDKVLCFGHGDVPNPHKYVTTISLKHKLSLQEEQEGTNGFNGFNQLKPARPKPHTQDSGFNVLGDNPVGLPLDAEILGVYTLDVDGNQQGTWNADRQEGTNDFNGFNQLKPARPKPHTQDSGFNVLGDNPVGLPLDAEILGVYTLDVDSNQQGTWNAVKPLKEPQHQKPQPQVPRPQVPQPQAQPTSPPPPDYFELTSTTSRPTLPPQPEPNIPTMPSRLPSLISDSDCGVVSGGNEHVPLVFHGQSYTRGDWPWLVAIYKRKDGSLTFACAGTLVSDIHVVTAAHCMQQRSTLTSIKDIVVKVGVYNLEDWGDDITQTRTLASATIHESYNASTFSNDLLVFTFDRSVEFNNNIRPACLWSGSVDLSRIVGASGVVAGWGSSELGPGSRGEPRMARLPIVSTGTCRASKPEFHVLTSGNTLCAGDRNGVGPCLGDSGGGMYLLEGGRWRLRGVVSVSLRPENGDPTCNLNEYVIFTDTAQYLQWIRNVMKKTF